MCLNECVVQSLHSGQRSTQGLNDTIHMDATQCSQLRQLIKQWEANGATKSDCADVMEGCTATTSTAVRRVMGDIRFPPIGPETAAAVLLH